MVKEPEYRYSCPNTMWINVVHKYTRTKKKRRVTYKDSSKGYNVMLQVIL